MIKKKVLSLASFIGRMIEMLIREINDTKLLALGSLLSNQQYSIESANINDYEFRIFSQFGDDGIIQYLTKNISIENDVFIEFGVGNYLESNTRFLLKNNNWTGFVMDGSLFSMQSLKRRSWFWRYCLTYKTVFIDKDNINTLIRDTGFSNIGLLHIDLDGNDYHILSTIDLSKLNPSIIITEYNSVFGCERAITVPYRKDFDRTKAHYSTLFFGASLKAFDYQLSKRGYSLVGSNLAGNNAYFVRTDLLNEKVRKIDSDLAFKESKFRESRNKDGSKSFIDGEDRLHILKGLEVINVVTNGSENL